MQTSRDPSGPDRAARKDTMRAIVHDRWGSPDQLELREVATPAVGDDEVLIRVRAVSVNPYDWVFVTGTPRMVRLGGGLLRPKRTIPGVDVAGQVEAVGRDVTRFRPGDEVFGMATDTFADYVVTRPDLLVRTPAGVSAEQAAAVPLAGLTALQSVRDKGRVRAGARVLVNGASGGVGTFAVQLAKHFGAEVTAVCSPRNVDAVRALGADHVVDYTREDFVDRGPRHELLVDIAGNRSVGDRRRALVPDGTLVVVGGPKTNQWVGPAGDLVAVMLRAPFVRQRMAGGMVRNDRADLELLAELLADGAIRSVVERTQPMAEAAAALTYVGEGHARGKVVLTGWV
jgi:NADPH:quinone reductase-like Zn-dependent oxidoreductase